ncbi:MAG: hypothetical protein Roseis2KO_49570 [Roseivirga sp.]
MPKLLRYTGNDLQDIALSEWLEQKPEALRSIAQKWFTAIKNAGHEAEAIFHDNYPIVCVDSAPFAYVNAYTSHVNLGFFYGAYLPDPVGLLEGTGKHMRHIKLRPGASYDEKEMLILIEFAYADILQRLMEEI